MHSDPRTISRDVEATIVPYGEPISIEKGTLVMITHRLGGNFTVTGTFGMARILGKDADALGEEVIEQNDQASGETHEGPPETEKLWDALKTVYDPEIPVNIVDLGLVYTLEILDVGKSNYDVKIDMTLTAPGCGMGPAIAQDAKYKAEGVPGVHEAHVNLVWDPPWTQEMISEEGKMELGLI